MSDTRAEPRLDSGIIKLDGAAIDGLPELPGHYRLLSSGQSVMFVGHAGDEGLREAIRGAYEKSPVAGVVLLEYSQTDTSASAADAAENEVLRLKPLYNEGYGRFRNSELSLPKKGHRIRKAMQNP